MLKEKSFFGLRLFIDFIIITFSFLIAASVAISFSILIERSYMFVLLGLMYIVWYFSVIAIGFYADAFSRYFAYQFINILKLVLIQIILAVFFIFAVKENLFIRNFTLIYGILMVLLLSLHTFLFKQLFSILKKQGKFNRNMLIIGAGEVGQNFLEMINTSHIPGYNIVGFVDDQLPDDSGLNLLGKIDDLEDIIESNEISEAVIALPERSKNLMDKIIHICNDTGVRTHIIPDYFKYLSGRFRVGMIGNFPIITVRNEPLEELHWKILKRTFDIIVSILIILLIASWLFPIIMIMIKLSSPGPVFFIQKRVGKNRILFKCLKFRTMGAGVSDNEYQPTLIGDRRVTRIGKFLRKTNLDETPQIFNVIFGSMSLVGPRPHPVPYHEFTKDYSDQIELRSLVKPGITGWAQVNGYRGDTVGEEENRILIGNKIKFDLWYVENWTFWLDIQIILLTIWQTLHQKNPGK